MTKILEITEPTLLLDATKCKANIARMAEKAKENGLRFRPHFKTHQSRGVAKWYREQEVDCITVSSLGMANYFEKDGWKDITIAFPVNILEMENINELAGKIKLGLLTLDQDVTHILGKQLKNKVNIWIKVDLGYKRTGVDPKDYDTIEHIMTTIDQYSNLEFKGFLGHAGHSYGARGTQEILEIHEKSIGAILQLKNRYKNRYPNIEASVGDTPTCSTAVAFEGIDEIRPGNFVFYDLTQNLIGSNPKEQIAVAMACPVVAKHRHRNEIILYGGGAHFDKDFIDMGAKGRSYGEMVLLQEEGWSAPVEGCYLSKLSQEHGTLKVTNPYLDKLNVGDIVYILPIHSCMTANAMQGYLTLSNEWIDHRNAQPPEEKTQKLGRFR